ncbi:MAG: hypothetical protein QW505_02810 [Thermoplasmata archaeon]
MRKIGILISDARLMFEIIEALKADRVPFEIIDRKDRIPQNISVMVTTESDKPTKFSRKLIICEGKKPETVAREAKAALRSGNKIRNLTIGIDPGSKTGVAVLIDDSFVDSAVIDRPEDVAPIIQEFSALYPSESILVRIGNGDRTKRNRIFNSIWDMGLPIEIVDESNTTKLSNQKDIDAAIEIALTSGYRPVKRQLVMPSEGEIADIQRKSRISSGGDLTISRALAEAVAVGEISMDQAIDRQRCRRKQGNRH